MNFILLITCNLPRIRWRYYLSFQLLYVYFCVIIYIEGYAEEYLKRCSATTQDTQTFIVTRHLNVLMSFPPRLLRSIVRQENHTSEQKYE